MLSSLIAIWGVVQVVLGISFLIFVHELGHFLVARYYGVECEIFSIGFGKAIWAWRPGPDVTICGWKPGPTEYRIAWVPIGGYVLMKGADLGMPRTRDSDDLRNKGVFARFMIFVAGVAMNLFFAVVLFSIAFGVGVQFVAPQVGGVAPGSPAWHAGLLPGDMIVRIDDAEIVDFEQIRLNIAFAEESEGVMVAFMRGGKRHERRIHPVYRESQGVQWIGIEPAFRRVINVQRGGPAEAAGLKTGDRLTRVHTSTDVDTTGKLIEALRKVEGTQFEVEYERDGKRHTATIKTQAAKAYLLGVVHGSGVIEHVRKHDPVDGSSPSTARQVGLKAGDIVRAIGEQDIRSLREARDFVAGWSAEDGASQTLTVERAGETVRLTLPRDKAVACFRDVSEKLGGATVGAIAAESPAMAAGITPGSTITKMNGVEITTWSELATQVHEAAGKEIEVAWTDSKGTSTTKAITPAQVDKLDGSVGFGFEMKLTPKKQYGFVDACLTGLQHSKEMSIKLVLMLRALGTNKVSPTNLGGPILIAQVSYAYVDRFGFGRFLYFLGLLSVNLVVLNLLPVPGLDGGHLLFLFIEAMRGKPLSPKTMGITLTIGFFMIVALIVFVVFNDILRLLQWAG